MDTPQRLDSPPADTSTPDRTPDVSLDNALSLRDAADAAGVTEKTLRRWIKGGRLHAIKLGGQYRITVADLERARSAEPGGHDQRPRPDPGQGTPPPPVDTRPDTGHGYPTVDLAPVMDHIARLEGEVRQLTEAATVWQVRAIRAEERLKALGAGDAPQDAPGAAERTEPPSGSISWWRQWLRKLTTG